MNKYRSAFKKAQNLGSAKDGTHHWWMQRVTALGLIPLAIWLIISVLRLSQANNHHNLLMIIKSPINLILLIVFLITATYHGAIGMQVIIEDYVEIKIKRLLAIILVQFLAFTSLIGALSATLTLYFTIN